MKLDCLSLNTLEAIKREAMEVTQSSMVTSERRMEAYDLIAAVNATLDRDIAWINAVRDLLDEPGALDVAMGDCLPYPPPLDDEAYGGYYVSEQGGDIYRDFGGES